MKRAVSIVFVLFFAFAAMACGSKIAEKDIRKSARYYEAAYISWNDEHDTLKAIRLLTTAVETNPDSDIAHYLLGNIRLGRAEYDLAEVHLRKALSLRGDDRPAAKAEAENSLGVLLIHMKKYDEAIALLKAASSQVLNREPWLAMGNLGWAYVENGQYDEAIDVLRRSLFEQPLFCVGRYRLGQAYYKKGDFETARPNLEEAVKESDAGCHMMQEAQHLLGMVYLRLEDDEAALAAFERCSSIDSTSELGVQCLSTAGTLK